MVRVVVLWGMVLGLSACAPAYQALPNATLGRGPDAPGYLIVGVSEQNYRWGLVTSTKSITLELTSAGQEPIPAAREGCGALGGIVGTKPCDLSVMDRLVLRVPPGIYTIGAVTLAYQSVDGAQIIRNPVVPPIAVRVGAGEIVDAGDFTFATDGDKREIKLVQHTHGAEQVAQALAGYPNLRGQPAVYRGDGR